MFQRLKTPQQEILPHTFSQKQSYRERRKDQSLSEAGGGEEVTKQGHWKILKVMELFMDQLYNVYMFIKICEIIHQKR